MDFVSDDERELKGLVIFTGKEGARLATELFTLASQFPITSGRFTAVGNDASLISIVLTQLRDFIAPSPRDKVTLRVLNVVGLELILSSTEICKRAFHFIQSNIDNNLPSGRSENLPNVSSPFPSFQDPKMDLAREDIKVAREKLTLILHVTRLAYSKKLDQLPGGGFPTQESRPSPVSSLSENILVQAIRSKVKFMEIYEDNKDGVPPSDSTLRPHELEQLNEEEIICDVENRGFSFKSALDPTTTALPSEDIAVHTTKPTPEDTDLLSSQERKRSLPSTPKTEPHDFVKDPLVSVKEDPVSVKIFGRESPDSETEKTATSEPKPRPQVKIVEGKTGPEKLKSLGNEKAASSSLSETAKCFTKLRSLISSPEKEIIADDPSVHYCMVNLRPIFTFDHEGYHFSWDTTYSPAKERETLKQLSKDQRKLKGTLTEQITRLSVTEARFINQIFRGLDQTASLLSLSLDSVKFDVHGIKWRGMHQIRIIYSWKDCQDQPITQAGDTETNHKAPLSGELQPRPTYIKVNLKYMDPRTLNYYQLPWEFDPEQEDMSFMIIKHWLSERDQEVLFEHSRRTRRQDVADSVQPRLSWEKEESPLSRPAAEFGPRGKFQPRDSQQPSTERPDIQRAQSRKPSRVASDSLFLHVDSRKAVEKENQQADADAALAALSGACQDSDLPSSGQGPLDDRNNDVVDKLLVKYTTLFNDGLKDSRTVREWVRL